MKLDANDPKWTAYAFDEIDDAERSAIESELRANPAARELVDELRRTGQLLRNALAAEPASRLTAEQRATLVAAAISNQPSAVNSEVVATGRGAPPLRRRRRWVAILGAVAASGLVAALLLPAFQSARETASRTRKTEKKTEERDEPVALNSYHDAFKMANQTEGVASGPARSTSGRDEAEQGEAEESVTRAIPITIASPSGLPSDPVAASGGKQAIYDIQKPVYETKTPSSDVRSVDTETSLMHREASLDLQMRQGKFSGASAAGNTGTKNRISGIGFDAKSLPVVTDLPIAYPDAKSWAELTKLRAELQQQVAVRMRAPAVLGDFAAAQQRIPIEGKEGEVEQLQKQLRELEGYSRGSEAYDQVTDNPFEPVAANPLSTFSIDVDTASYANIRRFLAQSNQLPPPAAVRIEEMLNYFRYDYPQPKDDVPFSVTTEVATCPWNADHRLVRVGLKGKEIAREKRPVSNLVFLLDVSGSMQPANKLPMVRESMKLLVRELGENDRVAIVVYAGASGMALDSTTGDQKDTIIAAIDQLQSGGSTNGEGGIRQAYDVATQNFIKGGTNRVILATDGDFNVGVTDPGELVKLIEEKAKSGVFLTTLGFGMGNLKDATLEQLADKGNGNYAYVDTLGEARKMFVEELAGTLVTIAKDVKLQIEFNPSEVASYRLIGYENRRLAAQDFNDDKKDAGEIGAGHTVTALYELVPAKVAVGRDQALEPSITSEPQSGVDPLRYQKPTAAKVELTDAASTGELFTLKLRYKQPDGDTSKLIEHPVKDSGKAYREASGDFKFASSVAAFGMVLRHSQHRGTITLDGIKELAHEGRSFDPSGYRSEFLTLIERAQALGAK